MKQEARSEGTALRRTVALLLALAHLADRAGSAAFPVRVVVLAILRHAEFVAWGFASEIAFDPSARGRNHQPRYLIPPGAIPPGAVVAGHHDPAEAARLAISLRALALIIASCAMQDLRSTAVPPILPRAVAPSWVCHLRNWRGPAALPAPDTS